MYSELLKAFLQLYDKTTNKDFPIRRIGVNLANVIEAENIQLSLFVDQDKINKERKLELTVSNIKTRWVKMQLLEVWTYKKEQQQSLEIN